MHADLLCKHSVYFKNHIQKARKDIEGECVICHETLDAVGADLTFCERCGDNLHQDCLGKWYQTKPTCPTCRTKWVDPSPLDCMVLEDLSADGFDMWAQWLYGSSLPTYSADQGEDEVRCIRLIDAHIVGDFVKDSDFVQVVRRAIISCYLNVSDVSRQNLIERVYQNTPGFSGLRRMFIDLHIATHKNIFHNTFKIKRDLPRNIIQEDILLSILDKTKARNNKQVWDIMRTAGHIEQDDENVDEGDDTGDESLED